MNQSNYFPLIDSVIYQQTMFTILGFLFLSAALFYTKRKKNYYFVFTWASLKSWIIIAPLFFILFGLPHPWPFFTLAVLSLLGAKIFFQIMGMYHRTWFVVTTYLGIFALSFALWKGDLALYNVIPMFAGGLALIVPFIRNNYKKMIQYISLSNLTLFLLGWAFLHLGWILQLPSGIYQFMYLVILTEFCDNTNLALSYHIGKIKIFNRIDRRRSLESTLISILLTIALAFGMRHLLPDKSDIYWLTSAIIASIGGLFGDLVMTILRKDAGIHRMGQFILGRGDFLHRMDRMIFVAPIYFYVMKIINYYFGQAGV